MSNKGNDLDLIEIFELLFSKKLLIFFVTATFAVMSVIYSLKQPNIYSSSALLVPSSSEQNMPSNISGISSLAKLGGISIPNLESGSLKHLQALKRVESFDFFSNHFLPEIKLENLMAASIWDHEKNTIVYDSGLYNPDEEIWVREVSYPYKQVPSDQEAYQVYLDSIKISEDSDGFINISYEHISPFIAKKWLDIIIKKINLTMLDIDKEIAQKSLDYLNKSSAETSNQYLKDSISYLMQSQMNTLMLASSNDDYVYKIIDSPIVPELKIKPNRAIICVLGTFIGFVISLFFIFFQYLFLKEKID